MASIYKRSKIYSLKEPSKAPRASKTVKTEPRIKHEPAGKDLSPIESESANQDKIIPPPNGRSRTRLRDGRSLSTSPPPAPPPVEFMRPGLNDDDIYMLVEDEFQAIAQSYTRHLHHAEYERLMKLARDRKAEQEKAGMDLLGGKGIPDNVSGETKQRLKRGLLKERQSSGLKSISGGGLMNGSGDEDSDEEAREAILEREEKKVGDMWAGTALSGLMSWDHSQEKTSLRGLEKISGETRASKGFGPSRKRGEQQDIEEVVTRRERHSKPTDEQEKIRPVGRSGTKDQATTKPTGNSTHASGKSSSTTSYAKSVARESNTSDDVTSSTQHGTKKIKIESKSTKVVRSKFRSIIDSLDDFDDEAFEATQTAIKSASPEKPQSRNSSALDREKRKRDRKDRLDEVPVFLM